uniref:Uncharacterized protein n=1 Tax=Arundo donax TaxID=35708 RepID=A0A0A9B1U6_ARUDO
METHPNQRTSQVQNGMHGMLLILWSLHGC